MQPRPAGGRGGDGDRRGLRFGDSGRLRLTSGASLDAAPQKHLARPVERSAGRLMRCSAPDGCGASCWHWASIARRGSSPRHADRHRCGERAANCGRASQAEGRRICRQHHARLRSTPAGRAPNFSLAQKRTGNLILTATGEGQGTEAARQDHPTGLPRRLPTSRKDSSHEPLIGHQRSPSAARAHQPGRCSRPRRRRAPQPRSRRCPRLRAGCRQATAQVARKKQRCSAVR